MAQVTVKQYVALFTVAMGSLFAGSSAMHAVLKPDLTIPELPKKEEGARDKEDAAGH